MLEVVEKLLILQNRDGRIQQVRAEFAQVEPQRKAFKTRAAGAQTELEAAKRRVNELETQRKELDLEVQAKKELIERYSNQQLQTRKNEEYRALAHEIEMCQTAIVKIEDQELEIMEQGEEAQKIVTRATADLAEATKLVEEEITALAEREKNLEKELAELELDRQQLSDAVETAARARYERLFQSKGQNVVVGVHHGVCGGCHMKLPPSILVACKAEEELVSCSNCGRILYYTRDMSLVGAD